MPELYYLRHLRSCAASTHGCRGATRVSTCSDGDPVSGWFTAALLSIVYDLALLGLQAGCAIIAAYCLQDMLLQCGVDCPWEACVAVVSGRPLTFLALTQSYEQWPTEGVPMVVTILLCAGWHCDNMFDCRMLSGAAAMAMTPSQDFDVCLLMFAVGACFPEFPPSGDEAQAAAEDGGASSDCSQASWWRDLADDVVEAASAEGAERPAQEDVDMGLAQCAVDAEGWQTYDAQAMEDAVDADGWQAWEGGPLEDVRAERPIPTDEEMKLRLRTLQEPLLCHDASSERNNCLLDSMLQALAHAELMHPCLPGDRRNVHFRARAALEARARRSAGRDGVLSDARP